MPRLIAVIGLPGSGKTTVGELLIKRGYERVYFGEVTFDKLKEAGLEVNEKNERMIREQLRAEHGIAAYAKLNIPRIERALAKGDVLVESMYSWEEYLLLKEQFPQLEVWAIYAPPKLRYQRLSQRPERPLTTEQARSRDVSQIENLHQAGPIAMADWTFLNTGSTKELREAVEEYLNDRAKSRTN